MNVCQFRVYFSAIASVSKKSDPGTNSDYRIFKSTKVPKEENLQEAEATVYFSQDIFPREQS